MADLGVVRGEDAAWILGSAELWDALLVDRELLADDLAQERDGVLDQRLRRELGLALERPQRVLGVLCDLAQQRVA